MSHRTASAAEDFLVMCDQLDHIKLVGEPSNGSTGQPLQFELPGGGWGRVCAKRDTYPDGRDFVGIGVQPDILVEPSLQDVLADNDIVLQHAVSHLMSILENN
jgi:C-terminal processing protease CtpA/Prc